MAKQGLRKAPNNHSEGAKPVSIRCTVHDLLRAATDHINAKNITTPEGFPVRVGLQDVAELAIKEFAKKNKVKASH